MRKKKRFLVVILSLLISVLILASAVSAEDSQDQLRADALPTKLWVASTETNNIPVQIDVFKKKTGGSNWNPTYTYQLYLPGNAVLDNCFLSWDGNATATVNNSSYLSGSCPVPPVNTQWLYSFKSGTQTTTFTIITYKGSANVPAVFIDIDESQGTIAAMDGDTDHNAECRGKIYINGVEYTLSKMKGRGNATWKESDDKKPYNITLDKKINFPGIESEKTKKWSLLAECLDRSLLGNRSGYHLANELGIGQDTASADVWMNGEYQGCYTVTPKTDSFVTKTGFMIEQDNYLEKSVSEGGDPQFRLNGLNEASGWSSCYNRITVKKMGDDLLGTNEQGEVDESPERMEAVAEEIQTWLQDAWDAIRSDTGYNSKNKYYTDYIDIESFAKMYLMHEYVKSYDVCAGSILFHRDGNTDADKLIAGPLWDLDNAMGSVYQNSSLGNADDRRNGDRRSAEGDFIQNITEYKTSIYKTISKHTDFMAEVSRQYNLNKAFFDSAAADAAQMIADIEDSAVMNHKKVNDLGNYQGKNNHYYGSNTSLGSGQYLQNYVKTSSWQDYAANLKTYITVRSLWFKNNYYDPNFVDPSTCEHEYSEVTVAATCTSDGSVTYSCPICGHTYTVVLPKIAHDYQNGACTVCGEVLKTAVISCNHGASVTVYETQDLNGSHIDNAVQANPRSSDTGMIDCGGDGQINFVVNVEPEYQLESVTAEPATSYKNFKLPEDVGVENYYRLTKVKENLTITVTVSGNIVFEPNGGTGNMPPQKFYPGADTKLNANTFSRTGYTFKGWNTRTDGSGTSYSDASSAVISENMTLYAQWTPNKYIVRFLDEDNTELQSSSVDFDTIPVYTGETPHKAADKDYYYSFKGWIPDIVPVNGNADYKVEFAATARTYGMPLWIWTGSDNTGYTSAEAVFTTNDGQTVFSETVNSTVSSETTPPECVKTGKTVYTATVTFRGKEYTDSKEVTIPATGHKEVIDAAIEPTCTDTGLTEGSHCSVCNEILIAQEVVPALDHNYQSTLTAPTCTENGFTTHTCSSCSDSYVDSYADALGHDFGEWAVTKAATCTEKGEESRTCSRCNRKETRVLDELGHSWGEVSYSWADDYSTVTATRICVNDYRHIETETVDTSYVVITPASETEYGIGRYTSSGFTNEAFTVQTEDVDLPPTGYNVTYTWADDNTSVTGTAVPYAQGAATITETVNAAYTVTKDAKCTESGTGVWTSAAFKSSLFAAQIKTVTIPATGHTLQIDAAVEPTCIKAGLTEGSHCSVCHEVIVAQQEIQKLGHSWDSGRITKASTCTETGIRTYTCGRCGTTRTEDIAALGHDYQTVVIAATCTKEGYTTHICSRCEDSFVDSYKAALGHAIEHHDAKTATCTESGWNAYETCSRCDYSTYVEMAALNHDWEFVDFTWVGNDRNGYTSVSANCRCKNDKTHTQTVSAKLSKTVTEQATCTKSGVITYIANYDGHTSTKKVTVEPHGHTFTNYISNNDADFDHDGTKTAYCDYGCGAKDTIQDKGSKLEIRAISIASEPKVTTYNLNESLVLTGGKIAVSLTSGKSLSFDMTEEMVSGFDSSKAGQCDVKVAFRGFSTSFKTTIVDNSYIRGDLNRDKKVTDADAVYLLMHTFFESDYPLDQSGDLNGDKKVSDADAVYLLMYTFFPEEYQLH